MKMVQRKVPKLDVSRFDAFINGSIGIIKENPNLWAYDRALAAGYSENDALLYLLTEEGNDNLFSMLYKMGEDLVNLIPDANFATVVNCSERERQAKLIELYGILNNGFDKIFKNMGGDSTAAVILETTMLRRAITVLVVKILDKYKTLRSQNDFLGFVKNLDDLTASARCSDGFKSMLREFLISYVSFTNLLQNVPDYLGDLDVERYNSVDYASVLEEIRNKYITKQHLFENAVEYKISESKIVKLKVKLIVDGIDRIAIVTVRMLTDGKLNNEKLPMFEVQLRWSDGKVIVCAGDGIPLENFLSKLNLSPNTGTLLFNLILDAVSKTVKEAPDAYVESQPVTPQTVKNETVAEVAEVVAVEDSAPEVQKIEEAVAKANMPKRLPLALFNNIKTSELLRTLGRLGVEEGRTGRHRHFTFNGISLPLPVHSKKPVSPKIIYGNLVRWGIDPCLFLDDISCDYSKYI